MFARNFCVIVVKLFLQCATMKRFCGSNTTAVCALPKPDTRVRLPSTAKNARKIRHSEFSSESIEKNLLKKIANSNF